MDLPNALLQQIEALTGARAARAGERIQRLWSGYGEIRRVHLEGGRVPSVVLKRVEPPAEPEHRRGWATDRSHARKLRSYGVEMAWYRGFAGRCNAAGCRVPEALHCEGDGARWSFVLEDLDAAGFPARHHALDGAQLRACLSWLARFHAAFLGDEPEGLWPVGTYWHLATRPDELAIMEAGPLRDAAAALDARLSAARYRTFVHGDAKVANFCFPARGGGPVAAVDFQYVGGGCGMKDVAYLFSSCLDERESERQAPRLLDEYFGALRAALAQASSEVDADALEAEWRALYPLAWADFYRFLAGWAPDHHKIHGYSRRMTEAALAVLGS